MTSAFLSSQRHAMPEMAPHGEPGETRCIGQVLHLGWCQRAADREGTVVMQDGVERSCEEPRPDEGTTRSHEIVHDDAAGRELDRRI